MDGIISNLKADKTYMLFILSTLLISILATHIPVSSIVLGDIHLLRESIDTSKNEGIGSLVIPIIIPIIIAINKGFKRFLKLKPFVFSLGMRSAGIAQE